MRLSTCFIPTLKEDPADAEVVSHRVMLKGGMVRPLAAGLYSYLPFLWKSLLKAMQIIREEMNAIGGQEFHFPALNPIDLWDETGRNEDFGDDVFRLKDRKGRGMLLAPTHEEVVGDIARSEIRSYRDMPQIWYQIQTKFRDEPRPRSGLLRTRQFIMKDAYTLDISQEALDHSYDLHAKAYRRIFTRCGLRFFEARASSGLMGGTGSQEFLVEGASGEDRAVVCDDCGYAGNVEVAGTAWQMAHGEEAPVEEVHTPGQRTIEDVSVFLGIPPERLVKSLVYMDAVDDPVMFLVPGSHDLNEAKASTAIGSAVRPAEAEEVLKIMSAPAGFVGPTGAPDALRIVADTSLEGLLDGATGANREDYHIVHLNLARDVKVHAWADLRTVLEGEACVVCGNPVRVITAIEMGHIFKLGTKYSEALGATFQDENEEEKPIVMGSYGIGVERIAAAAIETRADDDGNTWPASIAPYHVFLLAVNMGDDEVVKTAETLHEEMQVAGLEVLYDDRDIRAGVKFNDADLLGLPLRVTIGRKALDKGVAEVLSRIDKQTTEVPIDEASAFCRERIDAEIAGYDQRAEDVQDG
ncbi:proline--tRNA ligase [Gemmatimonadota bacterium]